MTKGFRTVKAGASAARPSANEVIATSEWPTMNIVSQGTFSASDDVIYEHNLGYFSPFMIFAPPYDFTSFTWGTDPSKYERSLEALNSRQQLLNRGSSGYYILFDYNLEKPLAIDKNIYSPTKNRDDKKGVKILRDKHSSRGMESPNIEDYLINTAGKSISVHMSGKIALDPNNNLTVIRHGLGYLPSYLIFNLSGYPGYPDAIGGSNGIASADRTKISIRGAQAVILGDLYYVILKEPFYTGREFESL